MMAESLSETPDPLPCRALKHLLPRLAKTIDPSVVSTELLAEEIITDSTWEEAKKETSGPNYDRNLKLLEHLQRAVRAKPDAFQTFCSILRKETVTEGLADELEDELRKLEEIDVEQPGQSAGTGDGSVTVVPRGDTTYCPISNDSNDCGSTSASLDIFLGQKLTLRPISIIKYEVKSPTGQVERKRLKLLEEISNSWRKMGQYMGIGGAVLDGWERQHPTNYDRATAVMGRFLSNGSLKYDCTWKGLIELVEDLGYSNVAEEFKEALICTMYSPPQN